MTESSNATSLKSVLADEGLKLRLRNAKFAICGELLFILLPLVVISIVELSKGDTVWAVLGSPEWSFGAAVLFGQSIMKLVAGFSHTKPKTWEKPAFVVSAITVLFLVPSLVVLALILAIDPVPFGLTLAQVIMFVLGVLVFYYFGSSVRLNATLKMSSRTKPEKAQNELSVFTA